MKKRSNDDAVVQKWLCCGHFRRTVFCPECGSKRPDQNPTSEAELLADEFAVEATTCFRIADTHQNVAESIRIEHELRDEKLCSGGQTWGDVVRSRESSATAFRKRGNKLAGYERIIRELLKSLKTDEQATKNND